MVNNLMKYIKEGTALELNVAFLYANFYLTFPEDYDFWYALSSEEVNHASLLRSCEEFQKVGDINIDISDTEIEVLSNLNKKFKDIISDFKQNPTRKKCFDIAMKLENSAGEIHYQKFMMNPEKNDRLSNVLKKLNDDDINHHERIKKYMIDNKIV